MAARLPRLLVLGLLLAAALPSAAAAVVRLPTSQDIAVPPVPPRGADPANASSYFGARYYRAEIGRFTTVDPGHIGGDVGDPQSWNAYAYARNNPLRNIDPDGRRWFTNNGNARWVDPNKDGSYTSPGEGWVELQPDQYPPSGMHVAFVDGQLSRIGEDSEGHKMLAPWMSPEKSLEDTTFSFLAPIELGAGIAFRAAQMLAANRLPDIGFKLLNPARSIGDSVDLGVAKSVVRHAVLRKVILKQAPVGQVVRDAVVVDGRTLAFTAFRRATGEIEITSIRLLK